MKCSYNNLWKMLIDKELKKQDLVEGAGLSSATVAKMSKGEKISEKSLHKICVYLNCDVVDIVKKGLE